MICKEVMKLVLPDNYFSDYFAEVQIKHCKLLKLDLGRVLRNIK